MQAILVTTICALRSNFIRHVHKQTCAKIPKRAGILDLQDPGSEILDIVLSFSPGILQILDLVTATLPWDPRDLGSRTEKILLDPGDPGSSLSRLSWDIAGLCLP